MKQEHIILGLIGIGIGLAVFSSKGQKGLPNPDPNPNPNPNPNPSPSTFPLVRSNVFSQPVQNLQKAILNDWTSPIAGSLILSSGGADGILGEGTENAIRRYGKTLPMSYNTYTLFLQELVS